MNILIDFPDNIPDDSSGYVDIRIHREGNEIKKITTVKLGFPDFRLIGFKVFSKKKEIKKLLKELQDGELSNEYISKKRILEKFERTKPLVGEDNSKERYRFMQWMADNNAIMEIPSEAAGNFKPILGRIRKSITELKHHYPMGRDWELAINECLKIIDKELK